ncbi:hypothetical protein TUM22923_13260 [Polynucleobacter sp. TUM22923]|jgi:cytochrome c-type biogenesis protein CcmH|uniref:c-type cytochrome biogenesis protein CcmI n=1 Tax=Polynucleobacter sp. TUM22923 TaxID=3022126 RepID=UPI00257223AB|nr:c-type cytochrome biogenesis protein CcmI [Polynucleobacter sp. TUM22923]BDX22005.1 hypothetical protein TUM22923_13260 [Polynucleobacter sp. TUM22923]
MTSFLIAAFLLLILVLVLLLRPFFFFGLEQGTSRRQMNAAIYREELDKLEAERLSGVVEEVTYEQTHAEMRQRLFQDTEVADDLATVRSPKKTIVGVCIFVALLSIGFYFVLGEAPAVAEQKIQQPIDQESVEKMVNEFATKLEKEPDNLKGWAMLARSYRVLGRNQDAVNAYARAGSYVDSDPQLLADYADALASNTNGSFAGKPTQLINKALALDPNNLLALWLSGTAAFNAQNYSGAIQSWEKLAKQLPPNSDEARGIAESIAEARLKGKLPLAPTPNSVPMTSGKGISGTISIAPEVKSQLKSGDVLMVIARKPGERMPVAVLRAPLTTFPMSYLLDDTLSMSPNTLISGLSEVVVEVRISKTGMAMPEAGDLISMAKTVKVGSSNVQLLVDRVRP